MNLLVVYKIRQLRIRLFQNNKMLNKGRSSDTINQLPDSLSSAVWISLISVIYFVETRYKTETLQLEIQIRSFRNPGIHNFSPTYVLTMLTDIQKEQNLLRNTFAVQSDTLNSYLTDGAILLESVIDESILSKLRTSINHSLELVDSYFHRQRVWEHDEACREFCLDSVAPAIAATFLQSSKINLLYDQVFAKVAGDPATPWHNDLPYWPVRNGKALTVWLTVDPIKFDAGPLEFIAGSHLWDKWFQPFTVVKDGSQADYYEGTDGKFDPLPDFESERDKHKILCWEMVPG